MCARVCVLCLACMGVSQGVMTTSVKWLMRQSHWATRWWWRTHVATEVRWSVCFLLSRTLFTTAPCKILCTAGPQLQLSPPLYEIHRQSDECLWCCKKYNTEASNSCCVADRLAILFLDHTSSSTLVASFPMNSQEACGGKVYGSPSTCRDEPWCLLTN